MITNSIKNKSVELTQIIPFVKVEKPSDILWQVLRHNQEVDDDENLVSVRLVLANNNIIEGIPVKIDKESNLVCLTQEGRSVTYIASYHVVAIEILRPELILDKLTNGAYFKVPIDKVPTLLELKRKFNEVREEIERVYSITLKSDFVNEASNSDKAKYQFCHFINILSDALNKISEDNLGNEALQRFNIIRIEPTKESFFVTKEEDQLLFNVNFERRYPTNFKQELITQIEEKL